MIKDFKIAERIEKEGKGCVIVVNKWDTIPNKNHNTARYYEEDVRQKLRVLDWAPIVYSTATSGNSVDTYETFSMSFNMLKLLNYISCSLTNANFVALK